MTSVDRTAYPRFGRVVSGRELAEAFTPTDAEVEWARTKTQDQQHLLALVVWLKSYQRLGYFPKVEHVPLLVVRHVRDVLGLGEDVALERAAVRSAKRHREFVRKRMKVVYDGAGVRKVAEDAIRGAVLTKDNPADLINVALEELVRARCELPGYTTLDAMAATIRAEVNNSFYQSVAGRLDAGAKARLARMLVVDPISRRSEFDRLKDVAQAASLGKFKQRLELLEGGDAGAAKRGRRYRRSVHGHGRRARHGLGRQHFGQAGGGPASRDVRAGDRADIGNRDGRVTGVDQADQQRPRRGAAPGILRQAGGQGVAQALRNA
ncbi:DUF4158 domain-containing protein [Nonomuraea sp. KM88]|uniref:DUF4158 domain-containing protein n=1 Tax=Nonomuraea sp. KM88 TaxID=3457427 RepID=UPI003FCE763F